MNDLTQQIFGGKIDDNQRSIAEVQASVAVAKRFPRDLDQVKNKIIKTCSDPHLAKEAIYTYPRGGVSVQGPSIRLAEELIYCMGNIDVGIRTIDRTDEKTKYEVFCFDKETNNRISRIYERKHSRFRKSGEVKLTDERDIYEIVASDASRRLRACILNAVPHYLVRLAVDQCMKTLSQKGAVNLDKLLEAFEGVGVKKELIEKKWGAIEKLTPENIAVLRSDYNSIKNNLASAKDIFSQNMGEDF